MSPDGSGRREARSVADRLRRIAGPIALLTLGIVLGLVASEVMIRATNRARYAERPVFYPRDSVLGWTPAPDLDQQFYGGDFSIHVATDGFGARLGALGAVRANARRVILLGDSYTFGWGVSGDETYPAQLDALVADRGLRAVNLGVSGYGTTQSVSRLERYLAEVGDAGVHAIVLLHSHNDPSDNVRHAAARRGLRAYTQERRNTGLHLHNLVRFVQSAVSRPVEGSEGMLPGGHRDFLFTVASEPTDAGAMAVGDSEGAPGTDEQLMWPGQDVLPTYERQSMTRLQLELLFESVESLGRIGSRLGVPVVHAAIHSAPQWYTEPIRAMVAETSAAHPATSWCGVVPAEDGFRGTFLNDHSGSHFTPGLNGFYARQIAAWVESGGCG